jgi:PAS domain S-box-containing protein
VSVEGPTETSSVAARFATAGVERYELALQAGRMGTWYWDVTANRIDWDDQLPRVFGLEPGEFDGTFDSYLAMLHPDDVEATVASIQDSVATGRDHYIEHRVIYPDGSVHWVSGTGRPIVGPDGEVVAMVGVGADISEQHAAHEATLAAEAATVIAQDAAARSHARLALLGRVSGVLGASLDVATTLQQVADIVVQERMAEWCAVEVPGGPHGVRRLALAHRDPAMVEFARRIQEDYPPQLRDDQGVGRVLLTGEPELWPSIPAELIRESAVDETHLELIESLQISAGIVVPLIARGRVLGVLSLVGAGGRTFNEDDLAAAMDLGARAGVALDNAYLYDDRDTVARTLQQSLLPHTLPDVPGLELAAAYRPGSVSLGIGGDFYDVFPAGEGSWRLVIGDVCGKGVEAAALTGAVRYALRTAAVLTPSPAEALAIVNDTLLREDWQHRFATLSLLAIDLSAGSVRVTAASGGHPPPLLRSADGTVTKVEAPGTIVGTLPDAQFNETTFEVAPGDCLFLYTDGIVEAGAPGEMFGDDRLAGALESVDTESAIGITGQMLAALDAFVAPTDARRRADEGRDDLALLTALVR